MKYRVFAVILAILTVLGLAACGGAPAETTPIDVPPVPTTPAPTTPAPTTPAATTPTPSYHTPPVTPPAQTTPMPTTPVPTAPPETTPADTTPAAPDRVFDASTVEGMMEDAGVPFPVGAEPVYTYINGMDEETTVDDPDLYLWYKRYLDGEGRVLYEERYEVMTDRVSDQKGYAYDESGNKILELVYTNRGLIRTEYDYEAGDQPTEIRSFAYHGGLSHTMRFVYDEAGRVTAHTELNGEGILTSEQRSSYYADGSPRRLISVTYGDGVAVSATVTVYDETGAMTVTVYNSDGTGEPLPENIEDLFAE